MFICPIWRLPSTRSPTIKKSRTIAVRALIRERNQTNARVIALSSSALPARTYLTPVPHCQGRRYNGSGHCQGRACNNSALRLATPYGPTAFASLTGKGGTRLLLSPLLRKERGRGCGGCSGRLGKDIGAPEALPCADARKITVQVGTGAEAGRGRILQANPGCVPIYKNPVHLGAAIILGEHFVRVECPLLPDHQHFGRRIDIRFPAVFGQPQLKLIGRNGSQFRVLVCRAVEQVK